MDSHNKVWCICATNGLVVGAYCPVMSNNNAEPYKWHLVWNQPSTSEHDSINTKYVNSTLRTNLKLILGIVYNMEI